MDIFLICRYDGHLWQLSNPFPVEICEVNDRFSIPYSLDSNESLFIAMPLEKNDLDTTLSCRYIRHISNDDDISQITFANPGYYDWIIKNAISKEIIAKGRCIVLPQGTRNCRFYQVCYSIDSFTPRCPLILIIIVVVQKKKFQESPFSDLFSLNYQRLMKRM